MVDLGGLSHALCVDASAVQQEDDKNRCHFLILAPKRAGLGIFMPWMAELSGQIFVGHA
jgi:hypothetical protein